jgi:hypothetical protein
MDLENLPQMLLGFLENVFVDKVEQGLRNAISPRPTDNDLLTTSSWRLFCSGVPVKSTLHLDLIWIKLL